MIDRLISDIVLFSSVFLAPWWFTVILAVIFLFYFDSFFEILAVGFLIDSLYNTQAKGYYDFQFMTSIMCAVVFIVSVEVKKRLLVYHK